MKDPLRCPRLWTMSSGIWPRYVLFTFIIGVAITSIKLWRLRRIRIMRRMIIRNLTIRNIQSLPVVLFLQFISYFGRWDNAAIAVICWSPYQHVFKPVDVAKCFLSFFLLQSFTLLQFHEYLISSFLMTWQCIFEFLVVWFWRYRLTTLAKTLGQLRLYLQCLI